MFCGSVFSKEVSLQPGHWRIYGVQRRALGLLGASGSSSTGLMIATRRPSLSKKKYVPPRPASAATGGCARRAMSMSRAAILCKRWRLQK